MAAKSSPEVFVRLRSIIAKEQSGGWDTAWQGNVIPWDAGEVQPPLYDLLQSNELSLPKQGRVLIPGCGRYGYDPIAFASELGLDALAIDISSTAVQAAEELLRRTELPEGSGTVNFSVQDFFTFKVAGAERFDIIYDYTFFVAIPPTMRMDWGRQMASLIKPGGYLITLVFPIDPPVETGPPFFVRPEHYVEVLGSGWESVLDKIPQRSLASHIDRERLVVWRRVE